MGNEGGAVWYLLLSGCPHSEGTRCSDRRYAVSIQVYRSTYPGFTVSQASFQMGRSATILLQRGRDTSASVHASSLQKGSHVQQVQSHTPVHADLRR